ncbi:MAG TPA: hypothetical protein VK184_12100 [Nostocaceae cyanobacterium]|nr:hypothetical protein [Nostocaceae cyanobacterium]
MRRWINYILILLLSVLIINIKWPTPNDSNCSATAFLAKDTEKFTVSATKVVVQPWLGKHHVYGIFMVPDKYKKSPFFVLSVKNLDDRCSRPFGQKRYIDGVFAEPETHLVRYYIRTRTAIQSILQGAYFDISNPQNWTLTLPEISTEQDQ